MNTFGLPASVFPLVLSVLHLLTSSLCDLGGGPSRVPRVLLRSSSELGGRPHTPSHSEWGGGLAV